MIINSAFIYSNQYVSPAANKQQTQAVAPKATSGDVFIKSTQAQAMEESVDCTPVKSEPVSTIESYYMSLSETRLRELIDFQELMESRGYVRQGRAAFMNSILEKKQLGEAAPIVPAPGPCL